MNNAEIEAAILLHEQAGHTKTALPHAVVRRLLAAVGKAKPADVTRSLATALLLGSPSAEPGQPLQGPVPQQRAEPSPAPKRAPAPRQKPATSVPEWLPADGQRGR